MTKYYIEIGRICNHLRTMSPPDVMWGMDVFRQMGIDEHHFKYAMFSNAYGYFSNLGDEDTAENIARAIVMSNGHYPWDKKEEYAPIHPRGSYAHLVQNVTADGPAVECEQDGCYAKGSQSLVEDDTIHWLCPHHY